MRKEANTRGESLPPTPYLLMELASRVKLTPWEDGYDSNSTHLVNLRRLVDRIIRGDGIQYLSERSNPKETISDHCDDLYGVDVDWANKRESRRAVERLFPSSSRKEKFKKALAF